MKQNPSPSAPSGRGDRRPRAQRGGEGPVRAMRYANTEPSSGPSGHLLPEGEGNSDGIVRAPK
jgi:hypothetical protein